MAKEKTDITEQFGLNHLVQDQLRKPPPEIPTITIDLLGDLMSQPYLDRLSSLIHGHEGSNFGRLVNIEIKNVSTLGWPVIYADYGGDLLRRALEALVAVAEMQKKEEGR